MYNSMFHYAPALLSGIEVTIILTMLSIIFGSIAGLFVGIVASLKSRVRIIARVYIEFFLGVPVLVLLVWLYYVLPLLHPALVLSSFWTAVLAFALSLSGFIGEIIESGVVAIDNGQLESALMLGLSKYQAIRHIILPQVFGIMFPALMTQYISVYKFSTLASVIAVNEIMHISGQIIQETYQPLVVYTTVAVFFIVTVYPLNFLARMIHSKIRSKSGLAKI